MKVVTKNPNLLIERLELGPLGTNCYIVTNQAANLTAVVDPSGGAPVIIDHLQKLNTKLAYILDTHGHFDHVGANAELQKSTGAKIYIHEADAEMLGQEDRHFGIKVAFSKADEFLEDGQILNFGDMEILVLHTPGHTLGGVCLLFGSEVLFSGDTLFQYSIGRTDFVGGSFEQIINSIKTKLFTLPDDVLVLPGHGDATTIGAEKNSNPYVRL